MRNLFGTPVIVLLAATLGGGCAASDTAGDDQIASQPGEQIEDEGTACLPGEQTSCACPGGASGIQICQDDGSGVGACDCGAEELPPPGEVEPCGDGTCSVDENCHTCTLDCGVCEPCDIAPSCDNAHVPAAGLPHHADLDVPKMDWVSPAMMQQRLADLIAEGGMGMRVLVAALDDAPGSLEHPFVTRLREVFAAHPAATAALSRQLHNVGLTSVAQYRMANPDPQFENIVWETRDVDYPGGTMECGSPMLRVGISKIKVHEEDDDFANDIVYCMVSAEAEQGSEIRVTPKTPNLDEGDEHVFALESGVFWGQGGVTTPGSNMLITYDCFEADNNSGYQALVDAIGMAAGDIGGVVEGDNGWIFGAAAAIAPVVSTGLALDSDDHLFNAQQTLDLSIQLELTNGAMWTVRRDGTHFLSDWDWELTVQAWGCAEYGTL